MAGGNSEPVESEEEFREDVMVPCTGGGGRVDFGGVLYHVSSGCTYIQFGDVGRVPAYWEDSGRVPPSVVT